MFFGRKDELRAFDRLWALTGASLAVCRGRRRVGKSSLVEEFARQSKSRFIKLEGIAPSENVDNNTQLEAFVRQLNEQCGTSLQVPANWFDAFAMLDKALPRRAKTVVLLDEISWMGKYDPSFSGELKYAWDNRFSKHAHKVFVLCGSVSAWIARNILRSKAFVGRISLNLVLRELPIRDCLGFWGAKANLVDTREVIDVLSVVGGIPEYLRLVNPSDSADENIRKLCFTPTGILLDEFDAIFDDVVEDNLTTRRKMLEALSESSLTGREIAERIGLEYNGHVSENLFALEEAGFIAKDSGVNPDNGKMSNLCRYRICDNYTRFYLKYMQRGRDLIKNGTFRFSSLEQLPGWNAIMGLQFECLVMSNLAGLLPLIGLDSALLVSAAPYLRQETDGRRGVQIDILLQTRRAMYVVEIKRKSEIGEDVIDEVSAKVGALRKRKGMSVRAVLVYDGRLSKRVPADGYFSNLIPIEAFFR
ncbi:MAG: ATPase [Kiritimatiellae bacterium]|nr:ATPase [Kiritimatiellia bacterium]